MISCRIISRSHVHVYVYMYVYVYVHAHVHVCTYRNICMYVCMYVVAVHEWALGAVVCSHEAILPLVAS